jgi:hypothetical protein
VHRGSGEGRPRCINARYHALQALRYNVRIAPVQYRYAPIERGGVPPGIMCQLAGWWVRDALAHRTGGEPTL